MPLALLLLSLLAPVPEAPPDAPVVVKGHAWAPFISPMGEPFRAHSVTDDTLADWFNRADRNRDGALTVDEMEADAERFFATLDSDRDGEIEPEERVHYEWEIAPDIQVNSKTRRAPGEASVKLARGKNSTSGLQGAARYGLLNIPEPVAAADSDLNRGITANEFRQAAITRFGLLDTAHSGALTLPRLELIRSAMIAAGRSKRGKDDPDERFGTPLPADR